MASVETNIIKEGLAGYDTNAGLSECDLAWNSGFLSQIGGGLTGINNGGNYLMSAAYFARGAGPLTAAQVPYSDMASGPPGGQQMAPYYVRDIEWYHTTADIKQAIMTYGAVGTVWGYGFSTQQSEWSSTLNNYVYYDPGPGVSNPGSGYNGQPTHAPAIVGWNDSIQTPGGTGAWIIRNSWGTDTQHFGVSYNDFYTGNDTPDQGACNGGAVSFHNVMPNIYQEIYYDNEFGWTAQQPYAYAFNHFTADQSGSLKSVSFYTTDDSVSYTISVYEQFQNGVLGQLATTVSGTESYEGFHTIDLLSLVPLVKGQDFYIELQTSNGQQGNDGDIFYQQLLDFGGSTTADPPASQASQSFFSTDGTNWTDLYSVDSTHSENFAIDGLTIATTSSVTNGQWATNGSGVWSGPGNWTGGVSPDTGQDTAVFGTVLTSGTANVTLENSISLSSLGFSTTGGASYIISASNGSALILSNTGGAAATISDSGGNHTIAAPVVLGSNLSVAATPGSTLTVSGPISETNAGTTLSVSGGGTLVLSGSNTYTGATTVNAGTLQIGSGGSGEYLASPSITMSNNATVAFNHTDTLFYAGTISGSGQLLKMGSGLLALTNANTNASAYTGPTTISAGTLQICGNDNELPTTTALTIASSGVLDLAGNNQMVGSLSGSAMAVVTDSSTGGYTTTLTVNPASGATTFAGNIIDSTQANHNKVALALTGGGELTLSGTNTYTGGTTVSGGTLDIAAPSALAGSGLVTIAAGGRLVLGSGAGIGALLAASSPVGSDEAALSAASIPATIGGYENTSGNMATLGDAPSLSQGGGGSAVGGTAAAVPEPGTIMLLIVGLVCFLTLWRAGSSSFRAACISLPPPPRTDPRTPCPRSQQRTSPSATRPPAASA